MVENIKGPFGTEPILDFLTVREKEIIFLILEGLDNSAISKQIYVSKNTLKTHIRHIYHKAEVKNRVGLLLKLGELLPYKRAN